ncbi:histidine kinase [Pseudonocardia asaccharolytica DSM 44247 = NBRC 16224]|uniref:histidine kinase n=2 Tax=Pseudonocardia asaccharolytica TaxID=54010 RepID=A0A511CWN6_9PSEU|nr:histidine kinase [Pseudonocardia asaccharolytica DSM 44247 = NBRC 16224]
MIAAKGAGTPVAGRRSRRWIRRHPTQDVMDVLAAGSRIATNLSDGLTGPRAGAAARELRRLLDAEAVGLVDLQGQQIWSGTPGPDAAGLAETVLRADRKAGRTGLVALPLRVRAELAGVLVVAGPVRPAATRQAAAWVGEALERGRLEASAVAAEQAELRALRAEISPHFVYNTLTTIASFVRSDPDRACDLILDFAEFIRHNLARQGDYTTLAGEFRAIEAYLALARAVLGDRLRVQVRIAPEVLPVAAPFRALQPLVENAVQHGVERAERGGSVQVSGEALGSECLITVEDDGPGMDPAHVREVLAGSSAGSSLGLVNVDRRLRTIYGPDYGLVIETAEGAGTRVLMRVPRFHPGVVAQ